MYARWQLHSLRPRAELAAQLVATREMVVRVRVRVRATQLVATREMVGLHSPDPTPQAQPDP